MAGIKFISPIHLKLLDTEPGTWKYTLNFQCTYKTSKQ